MSKVFRQRFKGKTGFAGLVGFDREGGKDVIVLVSYLGEKVKKVTFDLEDVAALTDLIAHAMKTKSRPAEDDIFDFERLEP